MSISKHTYLNIAVEMTDINSTQEADRTGRKYPLMNSGSSYMDRTTRFVELSDIEERMILSFINKEIDVSGGYRKIRIGNDSYKPAFIPVSTMFSKFVSMSWTSGGKIICLEHIAFQFSKCVSHSGTTYIMEVCPMILAMNPLTEHTEYLYPDKLSDSAERIEDLDYAYYGRWFRQLLSTYAHHSGAVGWRKVVISKAYNDTASLSGLVSIT